VITVGVIRGCTSVAKSIPFFFFFLNSFGSKKIVPWPFHNDFAVSFNCIQLNWLTIVHKVIVVEGDARLILFSDFPPITWQFSRQWPFLAFGKQFIMYPNWWMHQEGLEGAFVILTHDPENPFSHFLF
jgi:hypothetical protein